MIKDRLNKLRRTFGPAITIETVEQSGAPTDNFGTCRMGRRYYRVEVHRRLPPAVIKRMEEKAKQEGGECSHNFNHQGRSSGAIIAHCVEHLAAADAVKRRAIQPKVGKGLAASGEYTDPQGRRGGAFWFRQGSAPGYQEAISIRRVVRDLNSGRVRVRKLIGFKEGNT